MCTTHCVPPHSNMLDSICLWNYFKYHFKYDSLNGNQQMDCSFNRPSDEKPKLCVIWIRHKISLFFRCTYIIHRTHTLKWDLFGYIYLIQLSHHGLMKHFFVLSINLNFHILYTFFYTFCIEYSAFHTHTHNSII